MDFSPKNRYRILSQQFCPRLQINKLSQKCYTISFVFRSQRDAIHSLLFYIEDKVKNSSSECNSHHIFSGLMQFFYNSLTALSFQTLPSCSNYCSLVQMFAHIKSLNKVKILLKKSLRFMLNDYENYYQALFSIIL